MARFILGSKPPINLYYQRNGQGEPVAPAIDDPAIDIDNETKTTYRKYVLEATRQTNAYPVSSESPSNRSTEYGDSFKDDPQQRLFSQNLDPSVVPTNENSPWFPSGFTTSDDLGNYYTDGTQRRRALSGSTYIANANDNNTRYIDKALLKVVGYNQDNKFIKENVLSIDNNPRKGPDFKLRLGTTGYQGKLGVFATSSHIGQQGNSAPPANTALSIEEMQKIGLNILFDAVQGDAGLKFIINSESDTAEAELRAAIPSPQRLGTKVSLSRFTAASTLNKITNQKYNKTAVTNFYDNTESLKTYGSYYSPYNQFDSLISVGQIALAVALILAFVLVLDLLAAIVSVSAGDEDSFSPIDSLTAEEKSRLLGTSRLAGGGGGVFPDNKTSAGDVFSTFLGTNGLFARTYHESDECLDAGIAEFFGFSLGTEGRNASSLGATLSNLLTENGRITTVLREIIRSGATVVEGGIADFAGGVSISGIGNLFRKIRDLKIVKFINVLQSIGDKVLFESYTGNSARNNATGPDGTGIIQSGSNVSYVDSLPDKRKYFFAKSRLSDSAMYPKAISWSTRTAGMLALPVIIGNQATHLSNSLGSFINSSLLFQNPTSNQIYWGGEQKIQNSATTGRIPYDVVERYERELEADYVPFYIQDLRTNEILPFHAFVEDFGEDFNIDYSNVEGYGRQDKVYIHKATSRTVNVTFKIVATSEADHDVMWYKLNKLVTMIYPQWTQGRQINIGDLKFIQPFSQIPGATPVVRLRLGDMWKSNYSKMAIARLFGATTLPEYTVDGSTRNSARNQGNQQGNQQGNPAQNSSPTVAAANSSATPATAPVASAGTPVITEYADQIWANRPAYSLFIIRYSRTIIEHHSWSLYDGDTATSQQVNPGNNILLKIQKLPTRVGQRRSEIRLLEVYRDVQQGEALPMGKSLFKRGRRQRPERSQANPIITVRDDTIIGMLDPIRTNQLSENRQQTSTAANTERSTSATTPNSANSSQTNSSVAGLELMTAADFYSEDNNPILKSFKISGGKGLAGVITQFKIDTKGVTWGTDANQGLRAPTMVTINLTMAVIHDITPGLDANGIMNAPIWPVGTNSNFFLQNGQVAGQSQRQSSADLNYYNSNLIRRR